MRVSGKIPLVSEKSRMTVAYTMSPVHAPRIVGHFALCYILLDAGLMRRLAVVYGYGVAIAGDCLGAASVFFEMRCHDDGGGGGAIYSQDGLRSGVIVRVCV